MKVYILLYDEYHFFGVYQTLDSARIAMDKLQSEIPHKDVWILEKEAK